MGYQVVLRPQNDKMHTLAPTEGPKWGSEMAPEGPRMAPETPPSGPIQPIVIVAYFGTGPSFFPKPFGPKMGQFFFGNDIIWVPEESGGLKSPKLAP